jgi:hypothetical protein
MQKLEINIAFLKRNVKMEWCFIYSCLKGLRPNKKIGVVPVTLTNPVFDHEK